jgi:SRSO17 transposase
VEIKWLAALRPELTRFLEQFSDCIKTRPSREHVGRYIDGQLSDLPRKSVEPIAQHAGVPPRSLQHFLSSHRWDEVAARDRVQELVMAEHSDPNAIAVIDETSFPKKGDRTPGVQRQHCGASGKTENCVVTVHLGYVAKDFHALLDGALFLPESWDADPTRCEGAGIPPDLRHRPKYKIALELLQSAVQRGLKTKWLCADEAYGRPTDFRHGVADLDITYVVEIPCNASGWLESRLADPRPRRVDALWERGGPSWQRWHIKETGKGASVWEIRAVRFHPAEEKIPGEAQWLVIARNVIDPDEIKYFLSNAPADEPLESILCVAFSRHHIERMFRETKNELGMDHYEGRTYRGFMRHLVLTAMSLLYLSEQKQRIRSKKGANSSRSSRSIWPFGASWIRVSPAEVVATS